MFLKTTQRKFSRLVAALIVVMHCACSSFLLVTTPIKPQLGISEDIVPPQTTNKHICIGAKRTIHDHKYSAICLTCCCCYSTSLERWRHGKRPRSPRTQATPQDLDQRPYIGKEFQKLSGSKESSAE